jgi:DNA-binding PadR family transcriptional regulator
LVPGVLLVGRGVLSSRLKTLVRAGILAKRDYAEPGHRSRAEYRLTAKGRDLYPALLALSQWSDRWDPPKAGPAARVTDRETKRAVSVVMTSRADIRGLTIDDLSIRPGPGSKPLRRS